MGACAVQTFLLFYWQVLESITLQEQNRLQGHLDLTVSSLFSGEVKGLGFYLATNLLTSVGIMLRVVTLWNS